MTAAKLKIQDDVWASINGDEYLSEKGIALKNKIRDFMSKIEPQLEDYINKTEFPHELLPQLRDLGFNGFHIKDFGGPGLS